jgi:hypothetical protein
MIQQEQSSSPQHSLHTAEHNITLQEGKEIVKTNDLADLKAAVTRSLKNPLLNSGAGTCTSP